MRTILVAFIILGFAVTGCKSAGQNRAAELEDFFAAEEPFCTEVGAFATYADAYAELQPGVVATYELTRDAMAPRDAPGSPWQQLAASDPGVGSIETALTSLLAVVLPYRDDTESIAGALHECERLRGALQSFGTFPDEEHRLDQLQQSASFLYADRTVRHLQAILDTNEQLTAAVAAARPALDRCPPQVVQVCASARTAFDAFDANWSGIASTAESSLGPILEEIETMRRFAELANAPVE
jgi:hypothetical protein